MHPCRCRGLCGAAVTFLANDHMDLSAIGLAGRLLRVPGGLGVDLGAHDLAAPDNLSPLECSWLGITAPPSQIRNPRHVGTDRAGCSRLVKPSGRKHPKLLKALDRHALQIIETPFRLKVFARWQPRTSCPKGTLSATGPAARRGWRGVGLRPLSQLVMRFLVGLLRLLRIFSLLIFRRWVELR